MAHIPPRLIELLAEIQHIDKYDAENLRGMVLDLASHIRSLLTRNAEIETQLDISRQAHQSLVDEVRTTHAKMVEMIDVAREKVAPQ